MPERSQPSQSSSQNAPLTCPGCGSGDVTLRAEAQPYRGCWSCGLFFGEMTESVEQQLRWKGYRQFSVTRPEPAAS